MTSGCARVVAPPGASSSCVYNTPTNGLSALMKGDGKAARALVGGASTEAGTANRYLKAALLTSITCLTKFAAKAGATTRVHELPASCPA